MSFYKYHVFFCTYHRDSGEKCCAESGSQGLRDYAKGRVKALELSGRGKVRVNNAGCLDRCGEGPIVVIYPDGVWYTYVDRDDVDEIIERHLLKGEIVERLTLDDA